MSLSDKKFIKELRCLRIHLSPLLPTERLNVLVEAERRLKNTGAVSTVPVPSKQIRKITNTKQHRFNKYFYQ